MNHVVLRDDKTEAVGIGSHEDLALALHPSANIGALSVSHIAVHTDLAEIEHEWRAFEKVAACTAFQTFLWLSAWQRCIGRKRGIVPCIVTGRDADGALAFILPLAAETRGFIRRLSWLGHDLSDYNAPIVSRGFLRSSGTAGFRALWPGIAARVREKLGSRIDLTDLDKMPDNIEEHRNPLTGLDVIDHPSGAYVATLRDSWESFYAAKRSSATRRTERKKFRHLSEFGGVRAVDAHAPSERAAVVETLIGQKRRWFSHKGVRDIFAPADTRAFFTDVATDIRMRDFVQVTQLNVGEVAGAAGFGLRHRDRYYLLQYSYVEAGFTRYGPGRVLLYELMRGEIGRGTRFFDFTVGDEPYKRQWADIDIKLYDYLEPMTVRGWCAVRALLGFRWLKRTIKRTPALWRAYCTLRLWKARIAGGCPAVSERSEAAE
jgi:CelD/BcsL family acetyltransferase involved in cellulose biosynthesis